MKQTLFISLFATLFSLSLHAQKNPDAIIGKWMSEDNNLEVEVYKEGTEYKAKVLWFDDSDDKSKPWNTRLDEKNPKKELRSRRIAGLEVLHGLTYDEDADEWKDGVIYDSNSGKEWSSKVWLNSNNELKVRGYWLVSLLGETMTFKKT
ncbi:MAG: DUF2147 domain-containing protein [Bacteroidetes bacterium]|nr:DUF2147 domain-containing protein [Bacteroidota bacterium]